MREYVIQNVDFIQLTVNPGENRVYFPVSTHLQGKKILWLESYYVASGVTYDLAGRYPLLMSTGIYVTLYDMDGNLIVDSLTIDYFNSFSDRKRCIFLRIYRIGELTYPFSKKHL